MSKYKNFLINYGTIVFSVFFIMTFYSYYTYPTQKVVDTLKMASKFLVPLYIAPVLFSFERDEDARRLVNIINVVSHQEEYNYEE